MYILPRAHVESKCFGDQTMSAFSSIPISIICYYCLVDIPGTDTTRGLLLERKVNELSRGTAESTIFSRPQQSIFVCTFAGFSVRFTRCLYTYMLMMSGVSQLVGWTTQSFISLQYSSQP